jgi:hypothetical protein
MSRNREAERRRAGLRHTKRISGAGIHGVPLPCSASSHDWTLSLVTPGRRRRAQTLFEALSVFFHGLIRMYDAYRPAEGVCSLLDGLDPRPAAEAAYAARASSACSFCTRAYPF